MFGCVDSCVLAGLDVRRVRVEADISRGSQVEFSLVGLASTTVKEARARVRSAVRNSGLEFPTTRLTVNLAPAELRKEGTALDLPIAIAIVLARAKRPAPARSAFLGALALDGSVRHVDGVLVAARGLRELGYEKVFGIGAARSETYYYYDHHPEGAFAAHLFALTGVHPVPVGPGPH